MICKTFTALCPQPPTQLAETNQCLCMGTLKNQLPSEYMFILLSLKNKAASLYLTFYWYQNSLHINEVQEQVTLIQNQDISLPFQKPNPLLGNRGQFHMLIRSRAGCHQKVCCFSLHSLGHLSPARSAAMKLQSRWTGFIWQKTVPGKISGDPED